MMRITKHPVIDIPVKADVPFTFNGRQIIGYEGEVISSALFAGGIRVFGHHHRDGSAQGMYCANGQCAQCLVLADGLPVKACMTPVKPGMRVESCEGKPALPRADEPYEIRAIPETETGCLIIGGGPAGLAAAMELGRAGVPALVVEDKHEPGGKLTLQTHVFFGSKENSYAGKRGTEIAGILTREVGEYNSVETWTNSVVVGVYSDGKVGVVKQGRYVLVRPGYILVAAGAREKSLAFPGCTLPGVYGAGAFQTLVNRDLVRPAERLFVCGGGNVGLIAAYHAVQAGIQVAGLVEAMETCGGYKVHMDKIVRLGIPVYTSSTILRACGKENIESVTICGLSHYGKPMPETARTFEVDALLIAVGLSPVNELLIKAREYGLPVEAAGDAEEISEASAAIISGRIRGKRIAEKLMKQKSQGGNGRRHTAAAETTDSDIQLLAELKRKPGPAKSFTLKPIPGKMYPIIRCAQEIPCDPCADICHHGSIELDSDALTGIPRFTGDECSGCGGCVLVCPGLAIVLVDESYDDDKNLACLTLPLELGSDYYAPGDEVITTGGSGGYVGKGKVIDIKSRGKDRTRQLIRIEVPFKDRLEVAGLRVLTPEEGNWEEQEIDGGDTIICRCEGIMKKEIVALIRAGYRDLNQIKAALRTGMGACGGKTCEDLILKLFRDEEVPASQITPFVKRPPMMEVPLALFAGGDE